MFVFLKKLRYRLLQKNTTGKYLKYATGEIILVVIGILIALQINNWNENRKKDALKKEYTIALINDYVKDTIQLRDRLLYNFKQLNYVDTIVNYFNGKNIVLKDFATFIKNKGILGSRTINTYNTNSFNLLISSGNIDLFDKNVRKEIMELSRLQNYQIEVNRNNSRISNTQVQNISKYPLFGNRKTISTSLKNTMWSDINISLLPKDFINYMMFKRYTIARYIELTTSIQKQTKKVIELIKKTG